LNIQFVNYGKAGFSTLAYDIANFFCELVESDGVEHRTSYGYD